MVIRARTVEEVAAAASEKFGFEFEEIKDGAAISHLLVTEEHLNQLETPYGAHLYNLADITAGLANLSMHGGGPTISGTMNYVNGCEKGDRITCRARVDKCGAHISYVSARIERGDGTLVATSSFTFFQVQ